MFSEYFGDAQHQVGGRGPAGKRSNKPYTDDLGNKHVDRLPEHDRLGLDATNAPPQHAQSIDHRGMAVGTHQ